MLFHGDPLKVWHRELSDGQQMQRVNSLLAYLVVGHGAKIINQDNTYTQK